MGIKEILDKENLGTLQTADVNHAYGMTDKGIQVWLPKPKNEHWINVFLESDEIIVQKGNKGNDFQKNAISWNPPATVIFRYEKAPQRLDGEYRPVFHDVDSCLIIHAKTTLPIAQGTPPVPPYGNISWLSSFAATEEKAIEEAEKYKKKAGL